MTAYFRRNSLVKIPTTQEPPLVSSPKVEWSAWVVSGSMFAAAVIIVAALIWKVYR